MYEGELGKVELVASGDQVSGYYLAGGGCGFEAGRRVIDAQLEGQVLVGQITLCQVGSACQERVYPFLAIYDQARGAFTTDLTLEGGCSSPALRNRTAAPSRLTLTVVSDDRARRIRASVRRNPKKTLRLGQAVIANAHEQLRASKYALAAASYEIGLSYDENNWAGYMGLGVAQHHLGATERAIEALERSAQLNPEYADTYFNLACVQSRAQNKALALQALSKAIELGFNVPEQMNADQDLVRLLGDDPQFQQLLQQARARQASAGQR